MGVAAARTTWPGSPERRFLLPGAIACDGRAVGQREARGVTCWSTVRGARALTPAYVTLVYSKYKHN
eukprot:5676236-Pyramimonas_sp.AAC.1